MKDHPNLQYLASLEKAQVPVSEKGIAVIQLTLSSCI